MKSKLSFIFLFAGTLVYSQINLNSGLSACYAMNGNASDVVNNLNGTLTAVTATADRNNILSEALYFSGTGTCHVELPDNPLLKGQAVSFSAWIRSDSLPMSTSYILYTNNGNLSDFEAYALITFPAFNGHRFRVVKADAVNLSTVDSSTPVVLNTWYHVLFTMDNSQSNLYVNGTLENTSNYNFGFAYVPGKKVYLGATNESQYYQAFKGTMDNIRFYNRVLNAAEANALYASDPRCIEETVGLNDSKHGIGTISVFPNPGKGQFILESSTGEWFAYTVLDSFGRILQTGNSDSTSNIFIDLSEKPDGIYFLSLTNGAAQLVRKLVKN